MPSAPIRKGDSWMQTRKIDLGPMGGLVGQERWTFEGTEGGRDRVRMAGTLTFQLPPPDAVPKAQFRVVQGNLRTREVTGELWFDRRTGRLDRLELNVTLEGRVTLRLGEQETTADLAQTQKTTIQVKGD
jgi:hypothetical protein